MRILPQWLAAKRRAAAEADPPSDAPDSGDRSEADKLVDLANRAEDEGNLALALERIKDAIRIAPHHARAHLNLGNVLRAGGDIDGAIAATLAAIRLDEGYAAARCNLGSLYSLKGELAAAEAQYLKALELRPRFPEAAVALAALFETTGRLSEAQTALRRALADDPRYAIAAFNLSRLLLGEGKHQEAEAELRRAVNIDPKLTLAHCILGNLCNAQHRKVEAREWYAKALDVDEARITQETRPLYARAALEVGVALIAQDRWEEATERLQQASRLLPDWGAPYVNLAYIAMREARPTAAIGLYRKAIDLDPGAAIPRSYLLFALNMADGIDPIEVFAEHRRFGEWLAAATKRTFHEHSNSTDATRTLRVGYVSADYRVHPVAQFLAPVLEDHDPSQVEPFCYSNTVERDDHTGELERRFAKNWRDITTLTDDEVAELIVEDGIDILVDLSGHTGDSRLGVLAQKPAPIEVSWLGYLNTTGLEAMDYRLVDRHTDPVGASDDLHTERLVRLPDSQWVYWPMFEVPIIRKSGTSDSREVLFGSFNQYAKLSDRCLELWGYVMARLPHARLRVAAVPLGNARRQLFERLGRVGVAGDRVEIAARVPQMQYLKAYNEVDIALDSMPYNGATTALDSLWMGVPVVALAGTRPISRGTYSILKTLGRDDLIAESPEQYVELNVRLATDADWRNELHRSLREELRRSPLTDIPRFVGNLEAAYRGMWREWCASRSAPAA